MRKLIIFFAMLGVLVCVKAQSDEVGRRREALRQLEQRAEAGDAKALYDLATLHDTGYDTIPVDSTLSTILYRLSAERGYAPAQNYLGFRYFNGEAVRQDVDSALYWLAKAAGNGDVKAANNLGFLLANSDVVSRDYPQAMMWLGRAADAGLPSAKVNLADLLREGRGMAADTLGAVRLYNEAIQGGMVDAELKLLAMMGKKWMLLEPDSAFSLGRDYYLHGAPLIGVTLLENSVVKDSSRNDFNDGNDFIKEPDFRGKAYALLGDAYSRGIGVEYSYELSFEYFLRAALLGDGSAQFVIGELLDQFPDVLDSPEAAKIISEEMPEISVGIFENSDESEGVFPVSIYEAGWWYEQAASHGAVDADSAYELLFSFE